jgi:hypothetical protein
MELERIKRERDRLLQDQAKERALLKESQDAANRKQDDLNKIQKAMERDNICKASGAIEGAKTALDLQSRIETMVQDNRWLQRENESLTQQKVFIKGDTKRRHVFLSDDDSEASFPLSFLKFLQATTALQREVTDQISAVIPDVSFSSVDPVASHDQVRWDECQAALKAAFESSQHAATIEKTIAEIQLSTQKQLKVLHRSRKGHELKMESIAQSHAEEITALEEQMNNAKDEHEKAIHYLTMEIDEWKSKYKEIYNLKGVLEEKDSEIAQLRE